MARIILLTILFFVNPLLWFFIWIFWKPVGESETEVGPHESYTLAENLKAAFVAVLIVVSLFLTFYFVLEVL